MVDVVQLVRASDCGSECRGFESHPPPLTNKGPANNICGIFCICTFRITKSYVMFFTEHLFFMPDKDLIS